ncbi:MAG TPA: phosphate ABC transporter substrate-binding protein [bacterium]|nr:phosphate ABC transporter substrate-binding protein [bacterium]HQJ63420.1 phosphate ABC transporter substrate-binding protein [bacterium]
MNSIQANLRVRDLSRKSGQQVAPRRPRWYACRGAWRRAITSTTPLRLLLAGLLLAPMLSGCLRGRQPGTAGKSDRMVIQNTGSDTMVNLAQAWAESYGAIDPGVSVEVSGGGSGTGIASLINGTADIANCSRQMTATEKQEAVQNTGKDPVENLVGFDALAIFVNLENPLREISLEQLAEIYGEKGRFTRWSDLGVVMPDKGRDEIIVVSRQSNSGTYEYFREAVLGKTRDFRLGTIDMHGSKDVVELVARTPGAIGYSGMGYANDKVRMLQIARKNGMTAYAPTVQNTQKGVYPIARPLFMYTLGVPQGAVKAYLDWIHSPEGQSLVVQSGYVSLSARPAAETKEPPKP